ncbi:kidins220 [Symbiodinium necroappetens]|uniref:Kidins220 protein n=1 Tax=Symbiodinium necroappetens TaxID=1628268 RepID=A0A813AUE7_9DINO|nr:kidins220 [Symbiodinium necroappetens]
MRPHMHKAKAVLASDGIWEVVGQKDLPSLVLDGAPWPIRADTAKLQSAAFEGWASLTGGGYRDDVTSMVIPLGCEAALAVDS